MATAQDGNFHNGRQSVLFTGSVARTDTTDKILFTIPNGAIPIGIRLASPANSDAATTATLSVGTQAGADTDYLNAVDVKTAATGKGAWTPATSGSTKFGAAVTADTVVVGKYAETGTASTTGGPWVVQIECLTV